MMAKRIDRSRFDILAVGTRTSHSILIEEFSWWSDLNESIIGAVAIHLPDKTYGWVILIRDEIGRFRCADFEHSFSSKRVAEARLRIQIETTGRSIGFSGIYEQGDVEKEAIDILKPIVKQDDIHPYFKILLTDNSKQPARRVIGEIANWLMPADENFAKEFQTNQFDQRLWEIYLWASFREMCFDVEQHVAPDFRCTSSLLGIDFTVEATTVAPSKGGVLSDPPNLDTPEKMNDFLITFMPMKFGTPLTTKLNKVNADGRHYWELNQSMGNPFIIAIADFHKPGDMNNMELGSMTYTQGALFIYLYGHRVDWWIEDGKLMMTEVKVGSHVYKNKTIPSGFFDLPGSENISGILFANAGTMAKFDRMGVCAGFANRDFKYTRAGFRYNPNPDAFMGTPFSVEVGSKDYHETWSDELQLFHNPNAKLPIPMKWFPNIAHHSFKDGKHVTYDSQNRILSSMTIVTKYV